MAAMHHCPHCYSKLLSPEKARGPSERILLPLFLMRPFVCKNCRQRHYGFFYIPRSKAARKLTTPQSAEVSGRPLVTGLPGDTRS